MTGTSHDQSIREKAAFPARPTVLLRHDLPDGSWHVDWLLARDEHGRQPLISFRLSMSPLDLTDGGEIHGERRSDHRTRYLDYEGPLSDNRGSVRRLARGEIIRWDEGDSAWRLIVRWAVQTPLITQQIEVYNPDSVTCRVILHPVRSDLPTDSRGNNMPSD